MTTGRVLLVIALIGILLLLTAGLVLMRGRSDPASTSTETVLDCCQCTAIGADQGYPFEKIPGYTCEEYCYQGCLERDNSEIICKLGNVGGYELECPDVLLPTVTPYGE